MTADIHATLLLIGGTNQVVAERLGHSDVRVTLNTYSNVLPGMQKEAVKNLLGVLRKK